MSIEVRKLKKRFNGFAAVKNVSFSIRDGEFVTLLGPSGSGKSTVLRCLAGLEVPPRGEIVVDGKDVTCTPVQGRRVGFVFQHYALFKHMNVLDNVAFGLTVRKHDRTFSHKKAEGLLELVGLKGLENRMPSQLSGGQRQRVALARALAPEPRLLLLDEPFGALDTKLRRGLRSWLRSLHDEIGLTTLLVTHDQDEAFELSDRILVMNEGLIEQDGSPQKVFNEPATEFVATFVGETNRVVGAKRRGSVHWGPFTFPCPKRFLDLADETKISVLFRPIDVYVSSKRESPEQVPGLIQTRKFFGAFEELTVTLDGGFVVTAQIPKGVALYSDFRLCKTVYVNITAHHLFVNGR